MRCRRALCALAGATLALSFASSTAFAAILVTIDKSSQQMTVAVDGERRFTWPVSTGKSGYATPSGAWTAFRMEEDHFSQEWDDAPMPHSIFFTKDGHAIHGSFETKRLGQPASHGCVRLSPAHAAALFALVRQEGLANTRVVLTGSEEVALERRKAELALRDQRKREEAAQPKATAEAASAKRKAAAKTALRDKRAKIARRAVKPDAGYALGDETAPAYADPYDGQPRILRRYGQPPYVRPQYVQPRSGQPQYVEPGYVYGRRGYADGW
jgi:hypothetical protein